MKKIKEIRITYELDDWIESFITTAKVVFVIIQHSNMVSGPFMVLFFLSNWTPVFKWHLFKCGYMNENQK